MTATASPPPCAENSSDWDLTLGSPIIWQRAVRACAGCPIRTQCADFARDLVARGEAPQSMIWAGTGYTRLGKVIADLNQYRPATERHSRNTVVRVGQPVAVRGHTRPVRGGTEPADEPRRQLTLHHRTGSGHPH